MSNPREENSPSNDDVIDPHDDALPPSSRRGHAKVPDELDDEDFEAAEEQERVDAGLEDFAPSDVPPAADPPPSGTSEEAERAQRGLSGEDQ
ncbi:hypothetical protein [Arthrobacter pigmenti]